MYRRATELYLLLKRGTFTLCIQPRSPAWQRVQSLVSIAIILLPHHTTHVVFYDQSPAAQRLSQYHQMAHNISGELQNSIRCSKAARQRAFVNECDCSIEWFSLSNFLIRNPDFTRNTHMQCRSRDLYKVTISSLLLRLSAAENCMADSCTCTSCV
jgi:hypothetical protein